MSENQVIEYSGIRVVTTKQIAAAYKTDSKQISQGFNRNKGKFAEGKHYFVIRGQELKSFLQSALNGMQISSKTRTLYLWTDRGALLMAKIIDTDTAWEAYERLVDFYFEKKKEVVKSELPTVYSKCLPEKATVPAPLRPDWYTKNKRKLRRVCDKMDISHRELYHEILKALGKTYDINAAREIYKRDRGYYPEYAIDIVGYFPELAVAADRILNMLQ